RGEHVPAGAMHPHLVIIGMDTSFHDCFDSLAEKSILQEGCTDPQTTSGIPTNSKSGKADPCRVGLQFRSYLARLTAFLSAAPGVNFATLRAAILMTAPVWGLRPLRAFLWETENVPKPTKATRSPFFRAPVTLSTRVSMAVPAWVLLIREPAAILSIRSALFIFAPEEALLLPKETLQCLGFGPVAAI